jgi:hypothetical protein
MKKNISKKGKGNNANTVLAVRCLLDELIKNKTPNVGGGIRPIDYDIDCVRRTIQLLSKNNNANTMLVAGLVKVLKTPNERDNLDLLELVCELHSRALFQPNNKLMHDAYVEARKELENRLTVENCNSQNMALPSEDQLSKLELVAEKYLYEGADNYHIAWEGITKIIEAWENMKKGDVINGIGVPEWLTEKIRAKAKITWYEHKDVNDNKRTEAMRIVQRGAEATGYKIGIKKATELLKQYCL